MNKKNISLTLAIIVVVLAIIILAMIVWNKNQTNQSPQDQIYTNNVDLSNNIPISSLDINTNWYDKPRPIEAPCLFTQDLSDSVKSIKSWEVGEKRFDYYSNDYDKIIFIVIEPIKSNEKFAGYLFFDRTKTTIHTKTLIPLGRYLSGNILDDWSKEVLCETIRPSWEKDTKINSLEYPGILNINNLTYQLKEEKVFDNINDPFFHPEKSNVYEKIYFDKLLGDVFQNTDSKELYLKSTIGTAIIYHAPVE